MANTLAPDEAINSVRTAWSLGQDAPRPQGAAPVGLPTPIRFEVLGISHRTADQALRNRLGIARSEIPALLAALKERGVHEAMALSTCNRTEIYFHCEDASEVLRLLASRAGLDPVALEASLLHERGSAAARHLFCVAAGLESAVLGETEILSQLKEAWGLAREAGLIGRELDFALQRAMEVSKRVRTETEIGQRVTSVGSLSVREALRRVGDLRPRTVAVLGAGRTAVRILKELQTQGVGNLLILNRTLSHAEALAAEYGARALPLEKLPQALASADVLFAAVHTERPLLSVEALRAARNEATQPLVMLDLSVPSAIDPALASEPLADLVQMDALIARCLANSERRQASLPAALEILEGELERFETGCEERESAGTIQVLSRWAGAVRDQNLAWALDKLEHLPEAERKVVQDLALRMVRGFLQAPIRELKAARLNREERDAVERLFGLADEGYAGGGDEPF